MPHEISSPDIALAIANGFGNVGQVLTSQGTDADFIWQDVTTATGGITQPQADARYVQLSGAAPMSGPLILYADPTAANGAATKHYVDMMAAGFQGITQGQADARYVQLTGAVAMSGTLILGADPVLPLGAATKNYVDTHAAAAAPVQSVAGKQGTVTLQHTDITDWTAATANLGLVQSVAGRTGNVVLGTADITGFTFGAAAASPVQSVAGKTGTVTLTTTDIIGFGTVAAAAAPVQSVAGRIGAIVLSAADIANFNSAAALAAPVQAVAGRGGSVVLSHTDITDWNAATANLGKVTSVAGKIGDVTLVPTDIVGFGTAVAAAAPVISVAGRIGAIVLSAADITNFSTAAAAAAPVTSVAGKTGAVSLLPTDIANFVPTAAAAAPVQAVSNRTGSIVLTHVDITDWVTATANIGVVQSVAGKIGAVILGTGDIVGFAAGAGLAAPVQSVSGRTGNVTIAAADVVGLQGSITSGAPVRTVAGKTGDVLLVAGDIGSFGPAAAAAAPVQSVAGKTGAVVLVATDITNFNTAASVAAPVQTVAGRQGNVIINANDVQGLPAAAASAAPVQSVSGRVGAIILSPADITNFNSAAAIAAPVQTVSNRSGNVTLTHTDILDWNAATVNFGLVTSVAGKQGTITLTSTDIVGFSTAAAAAAPVQSVAARNGAVLLNHLDILDWNSATQPFSQWNVGSVAAIANSLVLTNGTLAAAAGSAQRFIGQYNAFTNTPSLGAAGTGVGGGVNGNTYVVNVAGTVAVDGVGAVAVSDQITNNGSLWVRLATSAALGTMASQNANNVNETGGTITGMTKLGLVNGGSMIPSLYPDLQWGVTDPGGSIGLWLDVLATLWGVNANFNTGTFTSLTASTITVPSLTLGTVSATVANAVTATATIGNFNTLNSGNALLTGGMITGQRGIGFANGDSIASSLYPDLAWGVAGLQGNLPLYLDVLSTLWGVNYNFNTGTINGLLSAGTVSVGTSLAVGTIITAPTVATGDVSIQPAGAPLPDVFDPVFDLNGNIIAWFGAEGYLHVTGLDAGTGPVIANGKTLTGGGGGAGSAPADALDVTLPQYGAVGDGVENYGTIWTSGNTLTIENFIGTVNLTAPINNLATLMIGSAQHCGWGFQPYDNGQEVMLTVGGTTIMGQMVQWQASSQVVLNVGSVAAIVNQVGTVVCPTFASDRIGKNLLIEGQGAATVWANNFAVNSSDPNRPQSSPFITTIASVLAPNMVTTNAAFPLAWNNQPGHILWGTNDAVACALCAIDAFNKGTRKIYYPGAFRLYLLLGIAGNAGRGRQWVPRLLTPDLAPLYNGVLWMGDNVRTYACDSGGSPMDLRCSQSGSEPGNVADRMIFGRGTFRRSRNLNTINVFLPGDSQVCPDPQVQSPGWMQIQKFIVEFTKANPGKTINYYYFGLGGSTWATYNASYISQAAGLTGGNHFWNVPQPIVGNVNTLAFMQNANQTGAGPAILPDVVFIGSNGGNDKFRIDPFAMDAMINTILSVNHGDGFGPPDIIMQTDNQANGPIDSLGNGGGVKVPLASDDFFYMHYVENLHRTTALYGGYGLVDMSTQVMKSVFGWSPVHRRMRNIPAIPPQTIQPGMLNAYTIPFQAQDYVAEFQFPTAASDAAVWASLLAVNGELSFGVSWNRGNRIRMRQGPNGNLWVGVSLVGETVMTACSITAGSKVLTVGAPQSFTTAITMKGAWAQISAADPIFTGAMAGQCILAPTNVFAKPGDTVQSLQRNFILGAIDANDVSVYDNKIYNNDMVAVPNLPVTVGGIQFMPQDSQSQPDVVLFYPDGTIFNTQVAAGGYASLTQATLVDAAPHTAVPGTPIPAFIGRMAPRWYDTGLNLTGLSSNVPGFWKIDVSRNYFMLEQKLGLGSNQVYAVITNKFMRRFGGEFYPRVQVDTPLTMQFQGMYVDYDKQFAPTTTAWEIRGVYDPGESFYLGGVGGHPASSLRSDVTDVLYRTQDLCTY